MAFDQNILFKIAAKVTGAEDIAGLRKQVDGLANAAKALAAALALKEIIQFGKHAIDLGEELGNVSQKLGISVDNLSKFKTAAMLANVPFDQLQVGIKKLAVNLIDANNSSSASAQHFRSLGISVKDSNGHLKATDAVLLEVSDKFSKMKDGAAKTALAVKLFGRAGSELIPVLNEGSAGMTKFGLRISDEFVERSKKFNDHLRIMGEHAEQFAVDATGAMLPALDRILTAIDEGFGESNEKKVGGFFHKVGDELKDFSLGVIGSIKVLIAGFDILEAGLKNAGLNIGKYLSDAQTFYSTMYKVATGDPTAKTVGQLGQDQLAGDALKKKKQSKIGGELTLELMGLADDLKKSYAALYMGDDKLNKKKKGGPSFAPDIEKIDEAKRKQAELFRAETVQRQAIAKLDLDKSVMSDYEYEKKKDQIKYEFEIAKSRAERNPDREKVVTDLKAETDAVRELAKANRESYGRGALEAINSYVEAATNSAALMKEAFSGTFTRIEDQLVSFVKTGKANFAELANFIADELIKIAVRQAILAPILGALGSAFGSAAGGGSTASAGGGDVAGPTYAANGGVMTEFGMMPLNKYANGGIARSPQMAVFGEGRTPEAYVPLPDGRSIPVSMKGGNGDVIVSVQVNMESGTSDVKSEEQKGKAIGNLMVAAIRQEILQQKRPGGLLA